jgi:flavin-dependent dehydrogenase
MAEFPIGIDMTGFHSYQVIIIGSGPAGVAAALTCNRARLDVLILTLADDPASKMPLTDEPEPLESLHPGVQSVFEQLGMADVIKGSCLGYYTGIAVSGKYSPLSTVPGENWEGFHVSRRLLDQAMLREVRRRGLAVRYNCAINEIVREGERVTGVRTNSGDTINCRWLIDATGRARLLGRKLKLRELFLSPPLIAETGVSDSLATRLPRFDIAYFERQGESWLWLAPLRENHCTFTRLIINRKAERPRADALKREKIGVVIHGC